jgi:hypothetical protein
MSHFYDKEDIRELSRRIAKEFETTYGTLDEKVSRVPDAAAKAIADKCKVHIEVARVAYRVMLDGVITEPGPCCEVLMREFKRRADRGSPVPDIESYMREVALTEGRWVEYLYGQLGKVLLHEIRNLANLSRLVADEIEPASEQVIAIIRQRRKIAEGFFTSLVNRWMKDHEKSTMVDALRAIAGGLLGSTEETIDDIINGARASLLIKLRRYEKFLNKRGEDSKLMNKVLDNIRQIMNEVHSPLERISDYTAAEILIEVMPPPPESIDEGSKYGFIHPAFPAHPRAGPPLKTPLDFLERDVWLAIMQEPANRSVFLREKINAVVASLLSQGTPLDKVGSTIIFDLDERLPWKRSTKTMIRRELQELGETAGDEFREKVEHYILENILTKIPQLRSTSRPSED